MALKNLRTNLFLTYMNFNNNETDVVRMKKE